MRYLAFVDKVKQRSGLEAGQAEEAAHSFFEMLAVFLSPPQAKKLASQIPNELAETVRDTSSVRLKQARDGFFEQVGSSEITGQQYSQAVWDTLKETISKSAAARIKAELPDEIGRSLN